MENCETGNGDCHPIILSRHSIKDTIIVTYPAGGTSSSIYLYRADSTFSKWRNEGAKYQPVPVRQDGKRSGEGAPVFDLTGLPDGRYVSHMLSCGVGGFLELNITTKN